MVSGSCTRIVPKAEAAVSRADPERTAQATRPEVLVTGGSGVLGRALVAHLVAEGWRVRALTRSARAERALRLAGAEPVAGHLLDPEALLRAAEGCELVFNVAGVNAYCQADPSALFEVNVRGALLAFRAAQAAGVRRFVHTSSAVTIGETSGELGSEASRHRGHYLTDYERAKHEAELALLSEPGALERVFVNPASVQGAGRIEGTGRLFLDILSGRQRLLVAGRLDLVDIEDCAIGHRLAAERGRPDQRYLLSGATLEMHELIALLSRLSGREIRPIWLARDLLRVAGRLSGAIGRIVGRTPRLCPETVRNLVHSAAYDGSLASRELGLEYRPVEATLAALIAWYRAQGWLTER